MELSAIPGATWSARPTLPVPSDWPAPDHCRSSSPFEQAVTAQDAKKKRFTSASDFFDTQDLRVGLSARAGAKASDKPVLGEPRPKAARPVISRFRSISAAHGEPQAPRARAESFEDRKVHPPKLLRLAVGALEAQGIPGPSGAVTVPRTTESRRPARKHHARFTVTIAAGEAYPG